MTCILEFERVYLAKAGETDPDIIFGCWDYSDKEEREEHISSFRGNPDVELVRNRRYETTLVRFLVAPDPAF